MHEPRRRHRRSSRPQGSRASRHPARAAPPASSRPFLRPGPSPRSLSFEYLSVCRARRVTSPAIEQPRAPASTAAYDRSFASVNRPGTRPRSITEGREPNAQVAHGEAVQVPGAATRDLFGLGSEKPGELTLEAQPRVLPDDALADCIGYLVAA